MQSKDGQMRKIVFLIACLCPVLVTLAAVLLHTGYVQSIESLVRSTTTANIRELTASKAQYLDEKIRSELLSLRSLAATLETTDAAAARELAANYMQLHDASRMWILDAQGNAWSTAPERENGLSEAPKAFFEAALRGETGMSDVFLGALGKRQVLFYTPIQRDGRVVGGLYEAYPVELLQNTYGGSTYNDAGYSYVLGKDGAIVLSPVRFSYLQIYDNFQSVLKEGQNRPETISTFMSALQSNISGTAIFDFEGKSQFLSFVPLEEKAGWYFVTVIPLHMVEKDGRLIVELTTRMAAVVVLAVVCIACLLLAAVYYHKKKRREYTLYLRDIYRAISENIDTVIFMVDGNSAKVEYVFENAHKVLGINAQAFSSIADEAAGTFRRTLQELLRAKPTEKTEWELPCFNDELKRQMWLKITALPLTLQGSAKYIFAVTDVTEDRQIRERLNAAVDAARQANAAKSRFLSNMSHDIRTPMNAIVGMTKLAEIHIERRDKVLDCLSKITAASRHLLNLINDVLDMSKIESGKMTLSAEPFSLPALVENVLAIVQPQCHSKKQTLSVETKQIRHEALAGDPLRLNQVLLNLLSNAVKFTPEHGSVSFSIEELPQKHAGYAAFQFQIADTGIGIAPQFLSTIFSPFERERTAFVHKTEGTGLGLAIAKNIVEAMGGQIRVESAEEQGSTFTIALELQLQNAADEALACNKQLQGLRALIVEDTPADLELLKNYLREFGMTADTAASGEEALQFVATGEPYDLVLLDWKLPGLDGIKTARQIQSRSGKRPKFVLVTAYNCPALETDAANQEIELLLQKPIFKSTLLQKLVLLFSCQTDEPAKPGDRNVLRDKRFLLVEDNALNREIAAELLELLGATVETAADGKAGAEAFLEKEAGYYDAIFMDIQMPVMDGHEAARQIRAASHPQAKTIPIVAMSANVFVEDVQASQDAGMNAHLGKPIDLDKICRVLQEIL